LTIVPKAATRTPRIPFVLLVVVVLGVGLVGLLLLNTSLERGAYTAGALRTRAAALEQRQQDLEMKVAALQQPERVAQQAERLGMVQNDNPAFIVLGTGKVLGVPTPGVAMNQVDLGAGTVGAQSKRLKVVDLPAGSHNTQTSGPVTVANAPGAGRGATSGNTQARSQR
jgi:cell division protein FtsL